MEQANKVKEPPSSSHTRCSSGPDVGRMTSCPGSTAGSCTREASADYGLGCGLCSRPLLSRIEALGPLGRGKCWDSIFPEIC